MKDIKIGNLIYTKKAVRQIILCLFLNVVVIGASVAYKQTTDKPLGILIIFTLILLPYLLMQKEIELR